MRELCAPFVSLKWNVSDREILLASIERTDLWIDGNFGVNDESRQNSERRNGGVIFFVLHGFNYFLASCKH